jgi:hypothetical protein
MKLIKILKKGQCVTNPALWKQMQNILNLVGGIAPLLIIFHPGLEHYLNAKVVAAAYGALGSINAYLTVATTDKIGL